MPLIHLFSWPHLSGKTYCRDGAGQGAGRLREDERAEEGAQRDGGGGQR